MALGTSWRGSCIPAVKKPSCNEVDITMAKYVSAMPASYFSALHSLWLFVGKVSDMLARHLILSGGPRAMG